MAEMFDENEAATMAAVKRVTDAQTAKGKSVGEGVGAAAGAGIGYFLGGPKGAYLGGGVGGDAGRATAGGMRGDFSDFKGLLKDHALVYLLPEKEKEVAPEESGWFDDEQAS